jgi:phosphatidylglycerol:prolipoprotein diacylglycerol transferase
MMGDMDIAFPNLGIYLRNVPKTIMVGNFGIALYGIIIATAMLCGITIAAVMGKREGQDPDLYWDAFPWIVVSSIVGARIYYVIFMWDFYKENLLEIFNLRGGGLAIYGGIILAVTTIIIYCKFKKTDWRLFLDMVGHGLVIGQVIGRWGNFFNREVFGEYTNSLFAMRLPLAMVRESDISPLIREHIEAGTNYIQVHPTYLYEGMWNLMVFAILLLYRRKKKFNGELFLVYLAGYGIGRAIIEYIRTDQLYLPGTKIPVSMVLGIVVASVSFFLIVIGRTRAGRRSPETSPEETQETSEQT